jgi:hypothetical protein
MKGAQMTATAAPETRPTSETSPASEISPIAAAYEPDPREVLDHTKKAEIAACIKLGGSRRLAAINVGCHHATIARTAERDHDFAKQLNEAESGVDMAALKRIQEASAENKNWRAAAWVLERRHPEEFGRKTPHTFSGDQVMALLAGIFNFTLPAVRKDKVNGFMREFNEALRDVESQVRRADRWRNMAEADRDNPRRNGKPLRSPYEHRQWFDPNRRESSPENDAEAFNAWVMSKLKDETIDGLQEEYQRKIGRSITVKRSGCEVEVEEESDEADAGAKADTSGDDARQSAADMPAKAGTPTEPAAAMPEKVAEAERVALPQQKPSDENVAAPQARVVEVTSAEWSGKSQPAEAERQEVAAAEATLPVKEIAAGTAAPLASSPPPPRTLPYPLAPIPDGKLPTEEAHQACRAHMEWLASIMGHKLFAINSLQQPAATGQSVPAPLGGAPIGWQLPPPKPR